MINLSLKKDFKKLFFWLVINKIFETKIIPIIANLYLF